MSQRLDFRFAGAGGQGIVLAGRVLAEAALRAGRAATHSQAYGPASRGGASRSDVVIADDEVIFPLVRRPQVLVILTAEAHRKYGDDLAPGGTLIVDTEATDDGGLALPIVETAARIVGTELASGVVALGVLSATVDDADLETLEATIADRVPAALQDANLDAFAAGRSMVG